MQLKIDLARGIEVDPSLKVKKLTLQERLSKPKKILENYDFRSVLRYTISQVLQTIGTLRIGFLCMMNYLVRTTSAELDTSDFEFLVRSILDIMQDVTISQLVNDEIVFLRARLCFTMHTITASLNESQQLHMASTLCLYLTSMEKISDNSLHIALSELGNIVTALGESAASVASNVQGVATIHLHSSSFAVRAQAAYSLVALSTAVPLLAVEVVKQSLSNAKLSVEQITSAEFSDKVETVAPGGGLSMKNPQALKLLEKMFFFHGHILVLSILLKNESGLPIGISSSLIYQLFDFGLELMRHDVLAAPNDLRQLICNLVRAGSLLITSCVSLGENIVSARIKALTLCCTDMISKSILPRETSQAPSEEDGNNDELLFEMMIIESAVLAFSSVLWYCSDMIHNDKKVLETYSECIDKAYKAVQFLFADKYKSHYRYRTLHVILIECYTMLPPAMCSISLFNGAFQTFRSFTLAGVESEQFSKLAESKRVFEILTTEGLSKPNHTKTIWKTLNFDILMLKLEANAHPLHMKEGEASVATFKNKFSQSYEKEINIKEYSPCARIESRSIDAATSILAIIFARENKENQDKLIQFCCDSITQVLANINQGSNNLFASEDEKKRKLKLYMTTLKNAIFVFYSLVNYYSFPSGVSAYDASLSWIHQVANAMITLLNYNDYDIRITASYTISLLVVKIADFDITESIARKVLGFLTFVNDSKLEASKIDWNSYCGHFVVLSNMWSSVEKRFITKEDITKAIFGTLKRIDSSYAFRAHALFALTIVASSKHKAEHLEKEAKLSFFETTFRVAEKHLLNSSILDEANYYHEFDLIVCCVLRLINVCVSVIAALYPHSSLIKRSCSLWRIMKSLSTHANLTYESIEFLMLVLCSSSGHLESSEVTSFLKDVLASQASSSFNSRLMYGVVKVIEALVVADPEGAYQGEVHILLLKLINRAVGSLSNSAQPSYFGVEFKSDPSNEEYLIRNVIDYAEVSLKKLVVNHCKSDPDTRVLHWVLFCRAICVPSRVNDAAVVPAATAAASDATAGNVMSYRQYAAWCNNLAIARASELSNSRAPIKSVALACVTEALKELSRGSSFHADIAVAQAATDRLLAALDPNRAAEGLHALPCYASLFLEDIVTLCCTCAAYTVEDIQLRHLQLQSLQCLATVIHFFKDTTDPHATSTEEALPLMLTQFMSQIMSAIRTCLNTRFDSKLLMAAGSLICILTQHKLLDDRVLIKRIAKLMFPSLSDFSQAAVEEDDTTVDKKDISDEYAAADHTVELGLAARLYALSLLRGHLAPREDVQATIRSIFEKLLGQLAVEWMTVVESTVLMVHGAQGWLRSVEPSTEEALALTNLVKSKLVRQNLVAALPYAIVACICTGKVGSIDVTFLLASLTSTVNESGISKFISAADINNLKFTSLLGLVHIFDYPSIDESIASSSWIRIIRKLLSTLKLNTFSMMERLSYIQLLLDLTGRLSQYLAKDPQLCSTSEPFAQWLWVLHLNIFSTLFSGVLTVPEDQRADTAEDKYIFTSVFPSPVKRFDIASAQMLKLQMECSHHLSVTLKLAQGIAFMTSAIPDLREHSLQLLLSMLYSASVSNDESHKTLVDQLITVVATLIAHDTQEEYINRCKGFLEQDLLQWWNFYKANRDLPILSAYKCTVHVILQLWSQLDQAAPQARCLPDTLTTLLNEAAYESLFIQRILEFALSLSLRPEANAVMETLFPTLLTHLHQGGVYDETNEKTILKLIFVYFDVIPESKKHLYLEVSIVTMLQLLHRRSDDVMLTTAAGIGITRCAKGAPEAFKLAFAALTDDDKAFLQSVMKNAVLMQNSTAVSESPAGEVAVKKIDLAKYKA